MKKSLYIFYVDHTDVELFDRLFNNFFLPYCNNLKSVKVISSVVTTSAQVSRLEKFENFKEFFNFEKGTLVIAGENNDFHESITKNDIKIAIQDIIKKLNPAELEHIVIIFNPNQFLQHIEDDFYTDKTPLQIKNYSQFEYYLLANKLQNGSHLFIVDATLLIRNIESFNVFSRGIIKDGNDVIVVSDSRHLENQLKSINEKVDIYSVPKNRHVFQVVKSILKKLEKENENIKKYNIYILVESEQYKYLMELPKEYNLLDYTRDDLAKLTRFYHESTARDEIPGLVDEDLESGIPEDSDDHIEKATTRVNNIKLERQKPATGLRKWANAVLRFATFLTKKGISIGTAIPTAIYAFLNYAGKKKTPKDLKPGLWGELNEEQKVETVGSFLISLITNAPINEASIVPAFRKLFATLHDLIWKRKLPPEARFALALSMLMTLTLVPVTWDSLEAEREAEEDTLIRKILINWFIPISFTFAGSIVAFATRFPAALNAYLRAFDEDIKILRALAVMLNRFSKDEHFEELKKLKISMHGNRGRMKLEPALTEFIVKTLEELEAVNIPIPPKSKLELAGEITDWIMMVIGLNTWPMWAVKGSKGIELFVAAFGADLKSNAFWEKGGKILPGFFVSSGNALFYSLHHKDVRERVVLFYLQCWYAMRDAIKRGLECKDWKVLTKPWAGLPLGPSGAAVQRLVHGSSEDLIYKFLIMFLSWLGGASLLEALGFISGDLVNASIFLNFYTNAEADKVKDEMTFEQLLAVLHQSKIRSLHVKGLAQEVSRFGLFKKKEGPMKDGYIPLINSYSSSKKDYGSQGKTVINKEEDFQLETLFSSGMAP